MKGFISKTLAALSLGGGLAATGGCVNYYDLVDPCYPQRYNYMARQEVVAAFAPQVNNGHVLDQTVWTYHFEKGTDRLTPGGMDHLTYLARRRPCPDPKVYLQTAQDVPYDAAVPEKFVEARAELDRRRIQAIEKFLNAITAGRPMSFEVCLHDPADVGMAAIPAHLTLLQYYGGFRGNLPASTGTTSGGIGGTAPLAPPTAR
jgi:hypothetical protein